LTNRKKEAEDHLQQAPRDKTLLSGVSRVPLDLALHRSYQLLDSPALRIAGGTDEIMRNTIGERVLGLAPDIRVDKGIPFRSIPSGSR